MNCNIYHLFFLLEPEDFYAIADIESVAPGNSEQLTPKVLFFPVLEKQNALKLL